MNLQQIRRQIDAKLADYNHARRQAKEEKMALASAQEHVENVSKAQKVMQEIAETVQRKAHERVSSIVSRCLQTVFEDEAYQFRVEFVQKRGRTEAELIFERDGLRIDDALESLGGGVCDVVSFALRLASLIFSIPRKRRLLLLDEPFKHVSAQYLPAIVSLIEALSKEMGVQFIVVTHIEAMQIGQVITL